MADQTKDKPIPAADDPFWTHPGPRALYPNTNVRLEPDVDNAPARPWEGADARAILAVVAAVWVVSFARGKRHGD